MRVNLHPALIATQAAPPGMRSRGWGRIVNISSLTVLGSVERTSYAAAKAALVSFTRSWALGACGHGVTSTPWPPGRPRPNCSGPTTPRAAKGRRATLRSPDAPFRQA